MTTVTTTRVPSFDPLQFRVDEQGQAHFDAAVFLKHRPALTSHLPSGSDTHHMELIICWYVLHRAQGGARNAALDQLLREVETEEQHGQGFSLSAGRA
ncbi:MAG: hypothetical protein WEB07_00340 [Natronospirillum sp.]